MPFYLLYNFSIYYKFKSWRESMKKVLFIASECVPFVKTGGLADVVGSLPKYLDKKNYEVRVIIPNYMCIKSEWKEKMNYLTHFYMDMAWRSQYVGIMELKYDGIQYYFIDNEYYFAGDRPYGNIYEDVEKFAFFSKAALSILPVVNYQPDIVHCHDWQTGLVPVYLNDSFHKGEFYADMKSMMTIHNLKFQGVWNIPAVQDAAGLDMSYFTSDKLEAFGDANYLKGGIVYADLVTTVSHTYAEEIKTPYYGEHLDGLMRARSNSLYGIINGLDYQEWNPKTDSMIYKNYSVDTFRKNKVKNKLELQKELGLEVDSHVMLIGIVSRLTDQKGFDLIDRVMDELCQDAMQIVVLGTGEERYENMFRHFAWKYNGKVAACIYYSDELSHKIYAASDAFLMPSLFEPCGLSQIISLRYGTIPIVRETGGLKDTVVPYNEYEETGTGISFTNYNAHEMLDAIRYAQAVYYDKKRSWNKLVERAMKVDFSWTNSARQYEELYDKIIQ